MALKIEVTTSLEIGIPIRPGGFLDRQVIDVVFAERAVGRECIGGFDALEGVFAHTIDPAAEARSRASRC
jgi:hypothetical protein